MKKKLFDKLILIFLLIQPFLDILYRFDILNLSINSIIRCLFLIFISIYMLFSKNLKCPIILFLILFIIYILNWKFNIYNDFTSYVSGLLKLFYFPITVIFFYKYENEYITEKVIMYILFSYLLIYLLSYVFGIGENIYEVATKKQGFKGLFNSMNEFSAIVISLLPITINYLKNEKKIMYIFILIILMFVTSLLNGTKVCLFGLLITLVYFLLPLIVKYFKKSSKYIKIFIIIFSVTLFFILSYLFTLTNTYKNMIVQADFFKVENKLSYNSINKVVFNDRLTTLDVNVNKYLHGTIYQKIFGIGYNNINRFVEIDIYDILFAFGIIGVILYISIIIVYLFKYKLRGDYLFSIILLFAISLTSGHVLLCPATVIYFSLILFLDKKNQSVCESS